MPAKISVITPSFNQAQYIEATIQSVLAQNYFPTEHLVIDGRSTDSTLSVLQRYQSHLRWVSEPDHGQADAINKGLRQASGELVAWLNSDDVYLPGALHQVARFFAGQPAVDVVYGDYYFINERGRILLRRREIPFDYPILLYGLNYISQPTVFFRRSLLDRFGYLDDRLHYGLDWEYWLRLARGGARFAHLPRYLAATRLHTAAKTVVAPPEMHHEHRAIRYKYWDKHRFTSARLQTLYESWLNTVYRAKRQALKVVLRQSMDWPPANRIMR
jgi:glycosyltransferase involved in cell wall biosynthesis